MELADVKTTQESVRGVFRERKEAAKAVHAIRREGIPSDHIHLLIADRSSGKSFAIARSNHFLHHAASGGAFGGAVGLVVGGLFVEGSLAARSAETVLSGWLVGAIFGFAVGVLAGAIFKGLWGLAKPRYEVFWPKQSRDQGSVLLGVNVSPRMSRNVHNILTRCGADDVFTEAVLDFEN